mgnify:CR=1 FL=1|tara:strand:- start:362 stop:565 length:204 start_codon:yes stop_codon:yes gene_type:complete
MQKLEKTVPLFQLIQWKHALKLEMFGMKSRGGSVYARIKKTFGWSGNREKIYEKLCDFLDKEDWTRE